MTIVSFFRKQGSHGRTFQALVSRASTRYHWFVLAMAALGWVFDCLDQQLFNLARPPAMMELLAPSPGVKPAVEEVSRYSGIATSIFLIGWATGGLLFGVLGDRIDRVRTMLWTIVLYSLFTGLSAFSVGFWDFAFYRFLTGLGVGGEFAVGVSLVAEVMPTAARPFALGLLQALSTIGNVSAALINIALGDLGIAGCIQRLDLGAASRCTSGGLMFIIGILPALLAVSISPPLEGTRAVAGRGLRRDGRTPAGIVSRVVRRPALAA